MKTMRLSLQLGIIFLIAACQNAPERSSNNRSLSANDNVVKLVEKRSDENAFASDIEDAVHSAKYLHNLNDPNIDLWELVRQGFKLDHSLDRKRVQDEITWFKRHPDYIERVTKRAEKFLYHIVQVLSAKDLPMEFALLPVIESAYDPFAYSHGRASGLWQFIPATARSHDIRIDWWYDGRRDVIDSTDAAATYLDHLYGRMGEDWLLALAAYNTGEGKVRSAIRKNQRRKIQADYWALKLSRETTAYVPRLLAICAIVANPESFGIELKAIKNSPYWKLVDIGSPLDLRKASELADIDSRKLHQLNAGYNQSSTHPEGPHRLIIPIDRVSRFTSELKKLDNRDRLTWTRYRIVPGDTLGALAKQFNTTTSALRSVNNLGGSLIIAGDSLLIPSRNNKSSFGSQAANTNNKHHIIKRGDSLSKIAQHYSLSISQLTRWNGINRSQILYPGQRLIISVARNDLVRKVSYRVKRGESFSRIANKFNLSVASVMAWNQKAASERYLHPGDNLMLFINVTSTE
mgnify:FL=1